MASQWQRSSVTASDKCERKKRERREDGSMHDIEAAAAYLLYDKHEKV